MKLRDGRKPVHMIRDVEKVERDSMTGKRVREILSCGHVWHHRLASGGKKNDQTERKCFQCVAPCDVLDCKVANHHSHDLVGIPQAWHKPA